MPKGTALKPRERRALLNKADEIGPVVLAAEAGINVDTLARAVLGLPVTPSAVKLIRTAIAVRSLTSEEKG